MWRGTWSMWPNESISLPVKYTWMIIETALRVVGEFCCGPPLIYILDRPDFATWKNCSAKHFSGLNCTIFCAWKQWSTKIKMNYVLVWNLLNQMENNLWFCTLSLSRHWRLRVETSNLVICMPFAIKLVSELARELSWSFPFDSISIHT